MKQTERTEFALFMSVSYTNFLAILTSRSLQMAPHNTIFNTLWLKEFPFIRQVESDNKQAKCSICGSIFSINHGGKSDIVQHINTVRHKKGDKNLLINHNIGDLFKKQASGLCN